MNCEQIRDQLTAYLLGDLDPQTTAEIRGHLEQCDGCRALAREIEPTLDLLRGALAATSAKAPRKLSPERKGRIEQALATPARKRQLWITQHHRGLAMAASVLFALGVLWGLVGGFSRTFSGPPVEAVMMDTRAEELARPVQELEEEIKWEVEKLPKPIQGAELGIQNHAEYSTTEEISDVPKPGQGRGMEAGAGDGDMAGFQISGVKSPLVLKGLYGGRSSGGRGRALSKYGGGVAGAAAADKSRDLEVEVVEPQAKPVEQKAAEAKDSLDQVPSANVVGYATVNGPAPTRRATESGMTRPDEVITKFDEKVKRVAEKPMAPPPAAADKKADSSVPMATKSFGVMPTMTEKIQVASSEVTAGAAGGEFRALEAAPVGHEEKKREAAARSEPARKDVAQVDRAEPVLRDVGTMGQLVSAEAEEDTGDFVALGGAGEEREMPSEQDMARFAEMVKAIKVPSAEASAERATPEARKAIESREKVLKKLDKIKIPEIDFRQANINDIVGFLNESTQEFDASSDSAKDKGVNMILNLGPEGAVAAQGDAAAEDPFGGEDGGEDGGEGAAENVPLVTFSAKQISALEALNIATKVAGLKYRIEDGVVMVVPIAAAEGALIHRMYDVPPEIGDKVFAGEKKVNAETGREIPDWGEFFARMGIPWPDGAKLEYDAKAGKLVVNNTPENLAVFEGMLSSLGAGDIEKVKVKNAEDEKRERAIREQDAARNRLLEKMDLIKIPEVDFRQANINDVLKFLNESGVRIEKADLGNNVPLITFSARYVSLQEALNIVTKVAGLKYRIEGDKVVVMPLYIPEGDLIRREYKIPLSIKAKIDKAASADTEADREDLKEFFSEIGVSWPAGAKIRYVPGIGKLIIVNTADNIAQFEKVIAGINPPAQEKEDKPKEDDLTGPRFKAAGVNPFIKTREQAFSTFSIGVDTASYTLMRNYMQKGYLPPAESVRTEEFVNFFDYAYTAPTRETFRIYVDVAPSKFGHGLHMMKIGVKGRRLGREEQRQARLTFLIDTSGSMDKPDRIGLVKKSLTMLVEKMAPQDLVAILQYDSHARLVLEFTPVSDKKKILAAIDALQCSGSTNLEEGMMKAYELAGKNYAPGGESRVLLLSDGVANLGTMAAEDILKAVEAYRKQGIFCSVFGVGMGTYDDTMLQTLAAKGDGTYAFLDSEEEAKRVFVDDLSATLNTIAKDVKIQVEFNPWSVPMYRQLGYESRQLKKEDFRNDSVDAGEVGSGQSVTALYEMQLSASPSPRSSPLEGEVGPRQSAEPGEGSEIRRRDFDRVATVRVRYRRTDNNQIEEIEQPVRWSEIGQSFDEADVRFRLAACAAEFAEILRGSPFADGSEFKDVADMLRPVALELNLDQQVQELLRLISTANGMSRAPLSE